MSLQGMTPFLEACGAAGPLQFGVTLPHSQERLSQVWHRPFVIIGRDPQSDIVLSDPNASRRHAYLQMIGGRVYCMDLGSRTGLNWGSLPGAQGWLDPYQLLRIGDSLIRITTGCHAESETDRPDSPLLSRPDESLELPYVTLEFINGNTDQANWPMYSQLGIIGRAPGCKVRLESPTVSRYHCGLVRTSFGVWVVDLQGREGVRVNGQRVRYAKLEDGDDLQLGRFLIRMHCGLAPRTWGASEEVDKAKRSNTPSAIILQPAPFSGSAALAPQRPTVLTQAGVEAVQSIVAPMMNEFAAMQQQMFDQFQESMFMLVKMFRSVNQEQMKEIHDELDQIRELTKEMKDLQQQLNVRHDTVSVTPQPDPAVHFTSLPETGNGSIDMLISDPAVPLRPEPVEKSDPAKVDAPPPLAHPATAPVAGPVPDLESVETKLASAAPSAPPIANGVGHATQPGAPSPPLPKITASAVPPGVDLHGWLTDRLSSIQTERQSRMQKILGMLTGKRGSGNPLP
ncbi:MAG: FHA domain-containing protein [Gemmataceae bacterium]